MIDVKKNDLLIEKSYFRFVLFLMVKKLKEMLEINKSIKIEHLILKLM